MTDLRTELVRLITDEIAREPAPVDPGTELLLSGVIDSLGVVRIVHWLEERLGIDIDPADVTLENFETVEAMARYAATRDGAAA